MERKKIKAFINTPGKTGLHVVPCTGFNFAHARTIAENICLEILDMVPNITTTEVSVSNRGNKLYLDPNQNDYADTVAAAYSVRPYKVPTVSTPLEWKELKDTPDPTAFTIDTIPKRMSKRGDPFRYLRQENCRKDYKNT